jgi:hypothetical protein
VTKHERDSFQPHKAAHGWAVVDVHTHVFAQQFQGASFRSRHGVWVEGVATAPAPLERVGVLALIWYHAITHLQAAFRDDGRVHVHSGVYRITNAYDAAFEDRGTGVG